MVNIKELKVNMVRSGCTQKDIAAKLGMSESSLSKKLKNNGLKLEEAKRIIDALGIENPADIFFAS